MATDLPSELERLREENLAICHNIVTGMGGEISVTSRLGHGTTFRVALPPANIQEVLPPPTDDEARARVARESWWWMTSLRSGWRSVACSASTT